MYDSRLGWLASLLLLGAVSCGGVYDAVDGNAPEHHKDIATLQAELIYDEDSRVNVGESDWTLFSDLALSSTVAIVPKARLQIDAAGQVHIDAPSLRQSYDFCDGELAFADEPTLADCSGVLVGPDLVLTAGHCVDDQAQCDANYLVFDYAIGSEGSLLLNAEGVFECVALIGREVSSFGSFELYDHALLRLDSVPGARHHPVQVRKQPVQALDPVVLIGNGDGLPTKIDLQGVVLSSGGSAEDYFSAQIDNFERGSGSPVFDTNGLLAGLAVRGGVDYDTRDSCFRIRTVEESSGLSEQVSYAHTALERIGQQTGIDPMGNSEQQLYRGPLLEPGCRLGHAPRRPGGGWLAGLGVVALAVLRRAARLRVPSRLGRSVSRLMRLMVLLTPAACSAWGPEDIGTLRGQEGEPATVDASEPVEEQCVELSAGTFEIGFSFLATPDDFPAPGATALPGIYELDAWKLWVADDLDEQQGSACKALLLSYVNTRMQLISISPAGPDVYRVGLRTDFPELASDQRTAEASFDVALDAATGSYVPVAEYTSCQRATGEFGADTWYGADPVVGSGARLVAVPDGWVAVIPYQGHSFCGVVEHYVRVGTAVAEPCPSYWPLPCTPSRRLEAAP